MTFRRLRNILTYLRTYLHGPLVPLCQLLQCQAPEFSLSVNVKSGVFRRPRFRNYTAAALRQHFALSQIKWADMMFRTITTRPKIVSVQFYCVQSTCVCACDEERSVTDTGLITASLITKATSSKWDSVTDVSNQIREPSWSLMGEGFMTYITAVFIGLFVIAIVVIIALHCYHRRRLRTMTGMSKVYMYVSRWDR